MKQLVRAIPDVFVGTRAQVGFEVGAEILPDNAVDTIGADQQIAIVLERIDVRDLSSKLDLNAEVFAAPLQNLEQAKAGNAGEAVAMNRDFLIAVDDVNIVPGFEVARDFSMRCFVGGAHVPERPAGKHYAPAEGIVGAV